MKVSSYVTTGVMAAFVVSAGTNALGGKSAPSALAQAAMDKPAVEKALMANEQKVNDAFAKKDVATFKSLVAADGIAVDMAGITIGMANIEQMMAGMTVTESQLSDMVVHWFDSTTAVVAYKWTGKGTAMGQPIPSPVYASTVWVNSGGKWMAHFHQETAAMAMPK